LKRILIVAVVVIAVSSGAARLGELSTAEQAALDRISPESLRTNLSFLASDELEGRGTPSPGLDRAADYIAAQFQRAGLEPAASDRTYFQIADFDQVTPEMTGFRLTLNSDARSIEIPGSEARPRSLQALDFADAPVIILPANGTIPAVKGAVVAGTLDRYGDEALLEELQSRKPALILLFAKSNKNGRAGSFLDDLEMHHAPVVHIHDSQALDVLQRTRRLSITLHLGEQNLKALHLRNVVALLSGSDPMLRDQYVMLTAHYDHLGKSPRGIFHGANDNASGTVSVIEIASALATLNPRPRRSILFVAFFGEEEGLLGSYHYAHSPLFPLAKTVAEINLEQMGRTDDATGKRVLEFAFTGPSYSNLPAIMSGAAKAEGIKTGQIPDADSYFSRSDNYALALRGVVAHTIAVAVEFPDYHGLGDTWQKIDYANMANVDRGVAAGVLRVANVPETPQWSKSNAAAVYREAGSN